MRRWAIPGAGNRPLLLVIALGVTLRLVVAWQPASVLLEKNLPDDALYYFVIAHNAVSLHSVSLDGTDPTNGFHPLWLVLMVPIFGGSALGGEAPIHWALTLCSLLDGLTIWLIAKVVMELVGREKPGVLAAMLYAANPSVILQTTNGLETAAALALQAALLMCYLRWLASANPQRWVLPVGLLGGLLLLARSDMVFFLALLLLAALGYWRDRAGAVRAILVGGLATLIVAPWLVWGRTAVGSWIQESGLAVPFAIRARFALDHGGQAAQVAGESLRQLLHPALWGRGDPVALPFGLGVALWVLVLAGLIWQWRAKRPTREMAALVPLIGASVLLLLFHAALRWYPRPWYFVSAGLTFAISAGLVVSRTGVLERRTFSVGVAFLVYYALAGYVLWSVGLYPWQKEMLAASTWLRGHLPERADVGSFNAGIYAYFSDRRVVNLDGVVNHEAFEAVREGQVLPYLRKAGIEYVVDYDSAIFREYAPFMGEGYPGGLMQVAVLGGTADGPLGLLRAYRVAGSSTDEPTTSGADRVCQGVHR